MTIHTFGTNATTSLQAIRYYPGMGSTDNSGNMQMSLTDAMNLNTRIFSTSNIGTNPRGILFTASTHSNTTLDTFASPTGVPLAAIMVGASVIGAGIPPGTFVVSRSPGTGTPTSVVLSNAATATASTVRMIILNPGMNAGSVQVGFDPSTGRVFLPNDRGYIKLAPGDVIATDNAGAVIVVPANSVGYAGSLWTYT
jgi:hypothetical protein